MVEKTVVVALGLDSRPAALFVQIASKFHSKISISKENKMVNAKSIMGVIALGVYDGSALCIRADGDDEKQALSELVDFLQSIRVE